MKEIMAVIRMDKMNETKQALKKHLHGHTWEFTRTDANTIEFAIPVAAGKEAVLSYTARVRY